VNSYAFAELQLPLVSQNAERVGLESLELSLSGRYDHYSDFGATTNPKVGLTYAPTRDLRLSGTYGRSFRAPLIIDLATPVQGLLFFGNDARFASGSAVAMELFGGSAALRPETSKTWTGSVEFTPEGLPGLNLSATYFSYDFTNKIIAPINSDVFSVPLSDPSIAPFTTFFPSPAQIAQVASGLFAISNLADPGSTVNDVQAILDNRFQNVSVWTSRGVDLRGSYRIDVRAGSLDLNLNSSLLTVKERPIATAGLQRLSGQVFGPAKLRVRGGAVWSDGGWTLSGYVNYVSGETDVYSVTPIELGAFVTADARIAYSFGKSSLNWLSGAHASLALLNVFDRDPPRLSFDSTIYPGIGYDPTNASSFGRLITLSISKDWGRK
jgi:iron complex outermembrane recepter protein